MSKSRDAFRTISEVSDALDTPAHVLRFWESKFSQVKPVKRAGGRRYYRPGDLDLLAGIKKLLHDDGMTIKGAQKILREQGVKAIAKLGAENLALHSAAAEETTVIEAKSEAPAPVAKAPTPAPQDVGEAEAAEEKAPTQQDAASGDVDITNVVSITPNEPAPKGPALSLNLGPKEPTAGEENTASATATPDIPQDPADNDSKAPARLFHILYKTSPDSLAPHAEAIAPLLARMRTLRDRVTAR